LHRAPVCAGPPPCDVPTGALPDQSDVFPGFPVPIGDPESLLDDHIPGAFRPFFCVVAFQVDRGPPVLAYYRIVAFLLKVISPLWFEPAINVFGPIFFFFQPACGLASLSLPRFFPTQCVVSEKPPQTILVNPNGDFFPPYAFFPKGCYLDEGTTR